MSKFIVETSARHIHVSEKDFKILCGEDATLEVRAPLSQPGQYVSTTRLDVVGPKKTITGVSILGPFRPETQIEMSLSDCRTLGVNAPIRESGDTLIFTDILKMTGGMPVGSSGKGLLLVSGGIDSPVAGYMTLKRGMKIDCIHFHSYPYTGEGARQKVVDLCKIISEYSSGLNLHIVSFTEIQEAIHNNAPEEYMITMMRRFMMRISEKIARKYLRSGN